MDKELLTIEFRYHAIPKDSEYSDGYMEKKITIGVYDTLEEAVNEGNKTLSTLSSKFKFSYKFGLHNGIFGYPNRLVTDFYSHKGIEVFVKITPLHFEDVADVLNEVIESQNKYNIWEK